MAARASYSQKPTGVFASRAASFSGHGSSGTDSSLESGRERRRKGKLKMQRRIQTLETQLADASSRITGLVELVNEMSRRCARQNNPSTEIFDLFEEADIHTSDAGAQTDISVDLNRPDIFISLPLDLPPHADANTACADAAAGAGIPSVPHLDQCGPMPREFANMSQDCSRQDGNSNGNVHCDVIADADLSFGPSTREQHKSYQAWSGKGMATPGVLHATSTRLRNSITDSPDLARPVAAGVNECDLTGDMCSTARRQALDDVNSEQRQASGPLSHDGKAEDFNSQNLASHSELLVGNPRQCQPDANYKHLFTGASQEADVSSDFTSISQDGKVEDFNSRNLALHSELFVDNQRRCQADASDKHLSTEASHEADAPLATGRRQALDDVNSEQRRASGNDPDGRVGNAADFNSQDLAPHSELLVDNPWQRRADADKHLTSPDRSTSDKDPWQDFGNATAKLASEVKSFFEPKVTATQSLATEDISQTLRPSERQSSRSCASTLQSQPVLPQGFIEVASSIIGVFGKRRNPTYKQVDSAASAIIRAAKKHDIPFDDCTRYVEGQSLALVCAISNLWPTT